LAWVRWPSRVVHRGGQCNGQLPGEKYKPGSGGPSVSCRQHSWVSTALCYTQVATKPTLRELTQDKPAASRKLRDIKARAAEDSTALPNNMHFSNSLGTHTAPPCLQVNPSIAASFVAPAKGPVALPASPACQLHASEPAGDAWQSVRGPWPLLGCAVVGYEVVGHLAQLPAPTVCVCSPQQHAAPQPHANPSRMPQLVTVRTLCLAGAEPAC
jgi:hypothetical protein